MTQLLSAMQGAPRAAPPSSPGAWRRHRRAAPATSVVAAVLLLSLGVYLGWLSEGFAAMTAKQRMSPYGRIGGRPIIPNPEAEKFPAGVPRDQDGFPVITLREQYETNVTMYVEGIGPYPGPPPDFGKDWDFIPLDPEDEGFDPDAPMPRMPMEPPEELMDLQPDDAIAWPEITPDEPIPESAPKAKRKVAKAAAPAAAPKKPAKKAAAAKPAAAAPSKADYSKMTVAELKKLLSEKGLAATGKKAELVARLEEAE